jgi:hypothetical protein
MLQAVYGSLYLSDPGTDVTPNLDYHVYIESGQHNTLCIQRTGRDILYAEDSGLFLYQFEKDMTIALELIRNDLYFIHSAALEYNGKIHLLVAKSGSGKSTTSWALLHHGFRYASDELGPVNLDTLTVLPYPHSLCLKREPPSPYSLPSDTLRTERTLHVPVESLPGTVVDRPLPLQSILFVQYRPKESPSITPISTSDAAVRVYTNGLNQLAHPAGGLDAAIQIAQHCRCYDLTSNDLRTTCELVRSTLDQDMGI